MVQTVRKVTEILELFSAEEPELGVSEVGRRLGIPKSTAHALMDSLADQRLLQRTDRGRYQLGWRLFEFSQVLLDTTQIRTAARAVMQDLVNRFGDTVHLATLDGLQAVYIEKLPRTATISLPVARKGERRSAHCSAVGKVLLAHQEWGDLLPLFNHQGLRAYSPNTLTDAGALREELQEIRKRGYGYDKEETSTGLCCVAAPVYNDRNRIIAAVSFAVPKGKFEGYGSQYQGAILEASRRISRSANRGLGTYTAGMELQGNTSQ